MARYVSVSSSAISFCTGNEVIKPRTENIEFHSLIRLFVVLKVLIYSEVKSFSFCQVSLDIILILDRFLHTPLLQPPMTDTTSQTSWSVMQRYIYPTGSDQNVRSLVRTGEPISFFTSSSRVQTLVSSIQYGEPRKPQELVRLTLPSHPLKEQLAQYISFPPEQVLVAWF